LHIDYVVPVRLNRFLINVQQLGFRSLQAHFSGQLQGASLDNGIGRFFGSYQCHNAVNVLNGTVFGVE
jgi:hypothetical protein